MAETLQDVRNKVEYEGFDYTFRHYSSFDGVTDQEFHRLRLAYRCAADDLEKYLNERTVGEDDE